MKEAGKRGALPRDTKSLGDDLGDFFGIVSASRIDLDNFAGDDFAKRIVTINKAQLVQRKRKCPVQSFDFFRLDLTFAQEPIDRHGAAPTTLSKIS
jgi:hypothetical protein